jgi:hypothetical protein
MRATLAGPCPFSEWGGGQQELLGALGPQVGVEGPKGALVLVPGALPEEHRRPAADVGQGSELRLSTMWVTLRRAASARRLREERG